MNGSPQTPPAGPVTGGRTVGAPDVLMMGFVGGTGGASVMMLDLADGLARRGIQVQIVVPAWDSTAPYAAICQHRGIQVERTVWLQERDPRWLAYHDAVRLPLRFRAPVVHYHLCTNTMPGRYLPAIRWLGSGRAFATIHDPYDEPRAGSRAARRWARAASKLFSKVICVSASGFERQLRYGIRADHLRLIHNGIDVDRFGAGDGDRARAQLGLSRSARLVVVSSRLAPQKRPLDALAAFARIASDCPDAHLVFVGEGAMGAAVAEEAARRALGHRVHLAGHRFDIPNWLAAATVWLLPTESEAFQPCLAVLEAMAAGCPIVTTACPGSEEVLVADENALLVPIGDVEATAAAVRRLLRDDELRSRLGAAARRATCRFSLDRMTEAYLDCYATAMPTLGMHRGHVASDVSYAED